MKSMRSRLRLLRNGLVMWTIALVGGIPSHLIRNVLYRHVYRIKIGRSSSIHWHARFRSPARLCIGHNTVIGEFALIDARSTVSIGNNVNIGGEVAIFTSEHDPDDPFFGEKGGPVSVGDYVYIGTRVTILPNVCIGKGAVVATGAVVTRDVPPYQIVGGVPATYIRDRSRDLRYKLDFALPFQ